MKLDELQKKHAVISGSMDNEISSMINIAKESERVEKIAHNAETILKDIDTQFEQITALDKNDITFLFFATMLQSLRWILMPELKLPRIEELPLSIEKSERMASNERNHVGGIYDGKKSGTEYELEALKKHKDKYRDVVKESEKEFYNRRNNYRSYIEILTQPVPFDAMYALDKKYIPNIAGLNKQNRDGSFNNIYGKNHHVATLGHDPILGWIFGTLNIMTNTISFVDFQSFDVIQGHRVKSLGEFWRTRELLFTDQAIDYSSPRCMFSIFQECLYSTEEDYKRIAVAVIKEGIHLSSDKYCVEGLPIPIISTINPEKAQKLIEQGWNSLEFKNIVAVDMKQIGISAGLAMLINLIIETIYLFCFQSKDDIDLRKVKIQRILSMSDMMAFSSNVLYVAVTKNIAKFDIGGLAVTMMNLLNSPKFIQEMKQEYIRKKFETLIMGNS